MCGGLEVDMIRPSSLLASVETIVSPSGPNVTDASEIVVSDVLLEVKFPHHLCPI